MPVRQSHAPGTPSWVDLATTDVEGALDFYAAVLGWDFERDPTGEINYVMAVVDGHPAAGVFDMPPEMLSEGVPPCWNVYVTVDDADEFAGQLAAAGGAVMRPAIDVPEPGPDAAGRMVIAADPTGAVFCTWAPITAIGAGIVNAPGAFTWAEVATHDDETLQRPSTASCSAGKRERWTACPTLRRCSHSTENQWRARRWHRLPVCRRTGGSASGRTTSTLPALRRRPTAAT